MSDLIKISIYIDGNNLYRGAKILGFKIDYKKFRGWLRQRYNINVAYIFIGFITERLGFYEYLKSCGFNIIFKETILANGVIKGNCDAELVLSVVSDFYSKKFDVCYLLTGDGDFGCLISFLLNNKIPISVIAPNSLKCSFLIRNKNIEIIFLNNHYHKFSERILSHQ